MVKELILEQVPRTSVGNTAGTTLAHWLSLWPRQHSLGDMTLINRPVNLRA